MSSSATGIFVDTECGESGETIVFIHGAMDRHSSFIRVRKLLRTHTTVAYDRRGYARSLEATPAAISLQDHVDDLSHVVGDTPATLVGHSYGGVVALCLADQKPELVRSLVVYEAPMSWTDWWPSAAGGSTLAVGLHGGPEAAAEAFMRRVVGDRVWAMLGDVTQAARRAEGSALLLDLSGLRGGGCPYDAARITCPTVIGCGAKSHPHQQRSASELAELLRAAGNSGVVLESIPDATHGAHASCAAAFTRLVEQALQAQTPTLGQGTLPASRPLTP